MGSDLRANVADDVMTDYYSFGLGSEFHESK